MSTNKERITRIAVGVDLSPESIHAVEQAIASARHQGAEVVLVYVGAVPEAPEGLPPSMRATASHYRTMLNDRLSEDRAALEALRQRLLGQGVQVSHVLVDGYPDTALAEAATSIGAGLVVVGTHGRTGVRQVLLGSVAEKTVRLADTSVLVVRGADIVTGGFQRIVVGSDFSPLADRAIARAVELAGKGARIEVVHAWTVPADVSPEGSLAAVLADLRGALSDDTLRAGAELCATWRARGRGTHVPLGRGRAGGRAQRRREPAPRRSGRGRQPRSARPAPLAARLRGRGHGAPRAMQRAGGAVATVAGGSEATKSPAQVPDEIGLRVLARADRSKPGGGAALAGDDVAASGSDEIARPRAGRSIEERAWRRKPHRRLAWARGPRDPDRDAARGLRSSRGCADR